MTACSIRHHVLKQDDDDVIDLTSPVAARIPFTDLTSPPCRPMRSLDDDDEEAILIFSSGEVPTNRADGVTLSTRARRGESHRASRL